MSDETDSCEFEYLGTVARTSGRAGTKYGLLALPLPDSDPPGQGDPSVRTILTARTWHGPVDAQIAPAQTGHWRTSIGSMEWDEAMERPHRLVLVTAPSKHTDDTNRENQSLSATLYLIWQALLLAAPEWPFFGTSWSLTGEFREESPRLVSVQEFGHLGPIARPFYSTREAFVRLSNERFQRARDPWFDRWGRIVSLLEPQEARLPELIQMALFSYEEASKQEPIEFRVSSFVRAAESILAIPRNSPGAETFANRVLQLKPSLVHHWFVGCPELQERLKSLYRHRNDCVHGKIPFLELRSRGELGADEAACCEYLAEIIARESILAALRIPALRDAAKDRETLEKAWDEGISFE